MFNRINTPAATPKGNVFTVKKYTKANHSTYIAI